MSSKTIVPNLVVAQRVLDRISVAASQFLGDETGEAMVGLVTPGDNTNGVPTLYVLDTISPDESAVRERHTFQQGDGWQDEVIWWLQENWHVRREKARAKGEDAKWNVPLSYLGDWHKQPGSMIAPSGGDLFTALEWLADAENAMDFLLVPIVTLDHPPTTDTGSDVRVNFVTMPQNEESYLRVDFWYIDLRARRFLPINPTIYPDERFPALAPVPWHLKDEDRVELEFARLRQNKLAYSVTISDTDDDLPLEVCIAAARADGQGKFYLVATPYDYPFSPPRVRLTPSVRLEAGQAVADVFEDWWAAADPIDDPPGWTWTEDMHIIDYIRAIEDHLGIAAPQIDDDESGDDESPAQVTAAADNPADDETSDETTE